jgi:hypothetical protein
MSFIAEAAPVETVCETPLSSTREPVAVVGKGIDKATLAGTVGA